MAYTYKQETVNRKEALLLCMPCILGILAYEVLQFYSKLYTEGTGESLFDIYGGYDLLCVCYYGVSFLTIRTFIPKPKSKANGSTAKHIIARADK